jgi:hypothetical protein
MKMQKNGIFWRNKYAREASDEFRFSIVIPVLNERDGINFINNSG